MTPHASTTGCLSGSARIFRVLFVAGATKFSPHGTTLPSRSVRGSWFSMGRCSLLLVTASFLIDRRCTSGRPRPGTPNKGQQALHFSPVVWIPISQFGLNRRRPYQGVRDSEWSAEEGDLNSRRRKRRRRQDIVNTGRLGLITDLADTHVTLRPCAMEALPPDLFILGAEASPDTEGLRISTKGWADPTDADGDTVAKAFTPFVTEWVTGGSRKPTILSFANGDTARSVCHLMGSLDDCPMVTVRLNLEDLLDVLASHEELCLGVVPA